MVKSERPLVSVIIPVYNVELYLEECLDSIIHQTLLDIEIICVNDGSTDTSPAILRRYANADHRIRIVDQENQGLSGARNTGVRIATGKYLYFIDSDDVLNTEALELCVSDMERRDLEFLCFNAVAFGEDADSAKEAGARNSNYFKRILNEEKVYTGQELFIKLKTDNAYIVPAWACMILRSQFLEKHLWFHIGIYYEDEPWMFAALMCLSRCGCLNQTLYHYRMRNGSIDHLPPQFAHSYGLFEGILDEWKTISDHSELFQNEQFMEIMTAHVDRLQKRAVRIYRTCSEEEKKKRYALETEKYFLFQQTVVNPASIMDVLERKTEKQRTVFEKKITSLIEDNDVSKRKNEKLTVEIRTMKSSTSWRLGRIITHFPRKIKKKIQRHGKKKTAKAKGELPRGKTLQSIPNRMIVFPSEVAGNHIVYHYQVSGEWESCFRVDNSFKIIYPFDLEDVPESIRIIPFLVQALPVSWLCDAEIILPVCDQDVFDCLEDVKAGYRKMHPLFSFGGKLTVECLENNRKAVQSQNTLVCFSGGVDSVNTTIAHLKEKPLLVSLWGSDVPAEDEEGWKPVETLICGIAERLGLKNLTVRTSFRVFLNEKVLSEKVKASGDSWWHGFQHGIGILGHMAPVTWHESIGIIYIASSNTAEYPYTCASDPMIDNFVRFCGAKVIHDGYDLDRQSKIKRIVDFCIEKKQQIPLHVCWEKTDGYNCCHCEKCWRTMLGLYAEGADPKRYGFSLFNGFEGFSGDIERDFHRFRKLTVANYMPIQKKIWERSMTEVIPQELSWFFNTDLAHVENGSMRLHDGKLLPPVWLLGTPNYRNIGDQCIAEEELNFLSTMLSDRNVIELSEAELKRKNYSQLKQILPSQLVVLQGGGNLGMLYPEQEKLRIKILSRIKDNPVIVFPQSIWFSEDEEGREALAKAQEIYKGDNILLCCRDRVSYRFAQEHFGCRSILVPDMALWESRQKSTPQKCFGAMTLLRNDKERKLSDSDQTVIELMLIKKFRSLDVFDTVLQTGKITKKNRAKKIDELVKRISSAECVVTDRLHGMILCAVSGTPCVVFGNGYHKIEAFCEWLKDLKYIRFIHRTDELADAIDEVCSCTERIYPEKEMREQFGELTRFIAGL